MNWKDAIIEVVETRVKTIERETGEKQTTIAERSEKVKRNFFTRLFQGNIKRLDLDEELEPLAQALGFDDALDLLTLARQKKNASAEANTLLNEGKLMMTVNKIKEWARWQIKVLKFARTHPATFDAKAVEFLELLSQVEQENETPLIGRNGAASQEERHAY